MLLVGRIGRHVQASEQPAGPGGLDSDCSCSALERGGRRVHLAVKPLCETIIPQSEHQTALVVGPGCRPVVRPTVDAVPSLMRVCKSLIELLSLTSALEANDLVSTELVQNFGMPAYTHQREHIEGDELQEHSCIGKGS